jgi:AraC-like DNA-binding protein
VPFVSAGIVKAFWQFAEREGLSRADLLDAAGLDATELDDGAAPVSADAMNGLLRVVYLQTQDPSIGMRVAETFDARMLGFWGYLLVSCLTMRQRLQIHMHYQKLLNPSGRIAFRVEGEQVVIDMYYAEPPPADWQPYLPLHYDFSVTGACLNYAKTLGIECPEVELRLPYPEQPHHARLRALVTGPVVFDAPAAQMRVPLRELDRRSLGDAYLLELARRELDRRIEGLGRALNGNLANQVRQQLAVALSDDPSLPRIARALRLSTRTLRRKLHAAGQSFQELLAEARRDNAVSYLIKTDHSIKEIAGRLGYRDPSNFSRAFSRWTGLAPVDYRTKHRPLSSD